MKPRWMAILILCLFFSVAFAGEVPSGQPPEGNSSTKGEFLPEEDQRDFRELSKMEGSGAENFGEESNYDKALVLFAKEPGPPDSFGNRVQPVTLRLLSGEDKGKEIKVKNEMSAYVQTNLHLEKGEKVLVYRDTLGEYHVADYLRSPVIYGLLGTFLVLLLLVGGKKGIRAILSLLLTVGGLLALGLPLILKGANPIFVAVLSAGIITFLTMVLIGGFSGKTLAAICGTVAGVVIAGILAWFGGKWGHLTGMSMDETQMLLYLPDNLVLDPGELLFAGIIWGSLGAAMDVGMSIASAVEEVRSADPSLTFRELFRSGMNVGRDVMGTMSNTLILAYLGSALPLILMIAVFQQDLFKIVNLDVIATEAVRSLAGSIGLILSIPLTALFAGLSIPRRKEG